MYQKHPSEELNRLYKLRPYQGQNPELAQIILLGLDANFAENIADDDEEEEYRLIKEYLTDGVKFWEKRGIHHPFMSVAKGLKDGARYHRNFAKLNLNANYAKHISFLELLDIPTVGNTGSNKKEFDALLDEDYLRKLENILFTSRTKKLVFISRSVIDKLIHIQKKYHLFRELPAIRIKSGNKAHLLLDNDHVCIYQVSHFSAAITDNHILEMRQIIDRFLSSTGINIAVGNKAFYGNSQQLALAICMKIIEELSEETDVRICAWFKDPGNYYLTLYPAAFLDVYKLDNIEEETDCVYKKVSSFINLSSNETLGTTLGLYNKESLKIPGWCNGNDLDFYELYQKNNDFQEVYDQIGKSLNLALLKEYPKCKVYNNSRHLNLLSQVSDTINRFENITFEIPCFETPFPYETVRFSEAVEDICEYELDKETGGRKGDPIHDIDAIHQ